MFLLSVSEIDDFFTRLFENLGTRFSWAHFFVLIAGIILGFVICASIYGVLMIISIRNDDRIRKDSKINLNPNTDKINQEVDEIKKRFVMMTEGMTNKERFQTLGQTIVETVNVVAGEYYPESSYPLYELSIEELIILLRYISIRIDSVFNITFLRPFKKMSVAQIFKAIDLQKKISDNKAVKTANKMKLGKASKIFWGTINVINPIYWFRKLVMGTTVNMAMRKLCLVIIDIVSDETNKTYSKAIFDQERALRNQEIEETLKTMEVEEVNE